ncbi:hypothetical protein RB195_003871 [Necator americanus]|uniref:FAD dependent oxidoreductase domain-containing protein n=1 Tax=Necator americanus TaxID=51031 RepID=A0ABR1DS08_NECAM
MVQKLCVVGAGIIGMSTAVALQQYIPEAEVTIVAAEFSPNLTSDVAAGLIEPYLCRENDERVIRWCRVTMRHIREYMKEVPNGGAQEMSGYRFSQDTNIPRWITLMDNVHILTPQEIEQKHPHHQKSGVFYTTLYLQPTKYLHYLRNKFTNNGGRLVKHYVETLNSITAECDCIVNCTGLGAKKLFTDDQLHPIRGQIIRVQCPAVKHFFMDDTSYVLLKSVIQRSYLHFCNV